MANSFKQMIKAGMIKRSDSGMFISIDDIHVRPDFNRREDNERTRNADDDTFNFLMEGVITLDGLALAEVLEIIDEQKKISADRAKAAV